MARDLHQGDVLHVIQTRNLTKRYGRQVAVDDIGFTVERGQVFGFLGPNGSGKTTTIGMLLGITTPSAGHITLFGLDGPDALYHARQRIGATLETPNFYPYLSGRDNLRIVANVKRVGRPEIDRVLAVVGLTARAQDRFGAYSLGMKQRLALAATMLGRPELVILDEPANGLDPEGMREIREVIGRLAEDGITVFLSSHLLHEVERTCTHVAIIKRGRIVLQSGVQELAAGLNAAAPQRSAVEARAGDPDMLQATVQDYPAASSVRRDGASVLVTLADDDPAALNAWCAARGVHLSHLAVRRQTLEDTFLELTREAGAPAMGGVA